MTDPVLNRENIRLWVDALRSGEYEQGRMVLASKGKYCCLGVACEVAIRNGVKMKVHHGVVTHYDKHRADLPPAVVDWLGLAAHSPSVDIVVGDGMERQYLTELNDLVEMPFAEIADAIERTYLSDHVEVAA
jgi:hypothetical protein